MSVPMKTKAFGELGASPMPWRRAVSEDGSKAIILDGKGEELAEVGRSASCNGGDVSADANLVAAAPDMYEALRLLLDDICRKCLRRNYGFVTCLGECMSTNAARIALKKAEGKWNVKEEKN